MTEAQADAARLLCLGHTKRAIGLQLGLTPAGVDGRLRRAYQATGAQCQIELGIWCVAHGVVTLPELQQAYCSSEHTSLSPVAGRAQLAREGANASAAGAG